jgi:tetratricopeptide (TPR) repeat protein
VRSFTSVLPYKNPEQSIKEIAQELQVNYILEGSYKRIGDELKITAQLIEPKNDNHIWLHDYELPYKEFIGIPAEIALKIADHLKAFISGEEKVRIERMPTNNLEAYEQYLLGKVKYYQHFQSSREEGVQYFKNAVQLDPDFALAYVYLAQSYQLMTRFSWVNPVELYKKTKEATLKAIELDESLGEAYAILGLYKITFEWDIYGPDKDFQKAIQLSPKSKYIYEAYAEYLRFIGRYEQGIKMAKRALDLDPLLSNSFRLGSAYFWAGEYEEALQELNELLAQDSSLISTHFFMALAYAMLRKHSEAIRCADQLLSIIEGIYANPYASPMISSIVGWVYAKTGETDKAEEILAILHEAYENSEADPLYLATVCAGLGETEKALSFLQKGYENRSGMIIYAYAMANNIFENLRSEPGFIDILEKIGFEVAWK